MSEFGNVLNPFIVICALGTGILSILNASRYDSRGFLFWGWSLIALLSFFAAIKWSITPR